MTFPENNTSYRAGHRARADAGITPLDGAYIRSRRIALGIGETTLGELLGVSGKMIDSLERGGDQNHLSLDFLHDLARILGCHIIDLFAERTYPDPAGDDPDAVEATDPATVGRHLATAGRIHVDELARILGWTSARVRLAIHHLEDQLRFCGQAIAWLADTEAQLVPAAGAVDTTDAISRRDLRAYGLTGTDAALLHEIITKGPRFRLGTVDTVALGRLRAAELVTTDTIFGPREPRNGAPRNVEGARLTDTARFNLCLDDD